MATNGKIFETELAQGSSDPKYLRSISSDGKSGKVLASQFAKQTTQTQINTRVTALEEDVDDLSGLPQQVATIGSNLGDLANLTTTAKNSIVAAINEVNGKANTNTEGLSTLAAQVAEIAASSSELGINVVEEGLYFVDSNNYIGAYIDGTGLHAINILETEEVING